MYAALQQAGAENVCLIAPKLPAGSAVFIELKIDIQLTEVIQLKISI